MTTFNTTRFSSSWLVTLAAFACVGLAAQDSAAAAAEEGNSVKVSYADLDLSSTAGATVLYGRIKRAAGVVCGTMPNRLELQRFSIWQQCYSGAISSAVSTVDSPRLTSIHGKSFASKNLTAALNRTPRAR